MKLSRKAINFDLDTNELKKRFSDTRGAYSSIKSFMLENGFLHRQYSGYTSIKPMSDYDITKLAEKLNEQFPWLSTCIQKFDVTDIGKQHSLSHIFKSDKDFNLDKNLTHNIKKNTTQKLKQQVSKKVKSNGKVFNR